MFRARLRLVFRPGGPSPERLLINSSSAASSRIMASAGVIAAVDFTVGGFGGAVDGKHVPVPTSQSSGLAGSGAVQILSYVRPAAYLNVRRRQHTE